MKIECRIISIEEKQVASGLMLRIKALINDKSEWLSCFDTELFEDLKNNVDKTLKIEYKENTSTSNNGITKTFKNIISVDVDVIETIVMNKPKKATNGNASFYISYAKDIYIAGIGESLTMSPQDCIDIINAFREAFE